jgi:glycosyltransferase involved in cell wall biosynthesis
MKRNKFKIIIPSYNNEEWVEYNIASIINQTYDNYEVLYIDDASTDQTYEKVKALVGSDSRFTIVKRKESKKATYNYFYELEEYLDNDQDIIVHIDGDDWLFDSEVLEKLNNFYNEKDVWMTYGIFYCYDGTEDVKLGYPQSTEYPDFIKNNKLFRRDIWRASHMRTYRTFLYNKLDKNDLISNIDNKLYWHAGDLAIQFPFMEMCPKDKVGVVDFPTYIYNQSKQNQDRTRERESQDNSIYETEVRNRKKYKEGLTGEKLPQVNVYYDYLESMDIPKKFSYCYKQEQGEYDMVLIGDWEIPNYVSGKIKVRQDVPIVARLLEHKFYFKNEIYNCILENYEKFDVILTHDKDLLEKLPNTQFVPGADVIMFNRLPNPGPMPPFKPDSFESFELPEDVFQIYKKTKLVSTVASNKAFLPGHVRRLEMLNTIKNRVDIYGTCQKALFGFETRDSSKGKFDSLKDYAFSIAIENLSHEVDDYYFTEKIVDCFITGTVPIYYGCPNIHKFFDAKGILIFTNERELSNILDNLSMDLYYSMMDSIKYNFEKSLKYNLTNDYIYENFYKDIIFDFDNCLKSKKLF